MSKQQEGLDRKPDVAAPMTPAVPLKLGTKLAYGLGSIAYGVKENGFNYFLLIFYSQVIGLDARLVGLALTIALVIDAISDPLVGYWSDNLRSRWGRRHPFMYASAIPVAFTYFLLWNPPLGWGQEQLFWYVLCLAVAIRIFITFYEIPSSALAPELARGYDERSSMQSYRYYFGWTGGNAMSVAMFLAIFPAFVTAAIPNGQFNRESYVIYGQISSVVIFASIMISALGTHSHIAHLTPPPPKRRVTIGAMVRESYQTFADRSFVALFLASILGSIATGLSAALSFYISTYFWGFDSTQLGIIVIGVFVSAAIGATMAPYISRTMGKKRGAIIIGLVAFLGSPTPIVLRLIGALPDNGDPFVFWFVLVTSTIDVGLIICFQILSSSMVADLVEQAELRTGRRSEGLFFAAIAFVRKAVQGLGLIAASLILTLAAFPVGARPDQVSGEAVTRLATLYVPTVLALWLGMIAVISRYRLSREDHESNLRQLAENRAATESSWAPDLPPAAGGRTS